VHTDFMCSTVFEISRVFRLMLGNKRDVQVIKTSGDRLEITDQGFLTLD
jgi:hypothetical protein